jgi:2-polyprenyl-3-methyl-5-hydroxy-6-metoxy-1,4-benzoquinol methylase
MKMNNNFDNYYESCFSETRLQSVDQSFDTYERCFSGLLPNVKAAAILDFGAGLGNLTAWLERNGMSDIVSIDISRDQCEAARKLGVNVKHISNPLAFLKTKVDTFDVVFMSDVIEHLPKHEIIAYLRAMRACLKENGYLVIKTENVATPTGIYQHHMDFTHEYNFVDKSLKQVLLMSGFKDIMIIGHSMKWPKRPWLWWKPIVRMIYINLIKLIYAAEQPRGTNNPQIFSNSLIARALK